ncbi:hypothetical protein [Bifidobacterium aquikefiri]|uniref:hypothetical protein n=1 Tax=Bifidobacterium aquikefiri TaxID=1653207 RepID=UPI0011784A9C
MGESARNAASIATTPVAARCKTVPMLFTYLYIAAMFALTVAGVGTVIWIAMKYRPKYSAAVALRNLHKEQLTYHNPNQVESTLGDLDDQAMRLSEEELDAEIALITKLNGNSRHLGVVMKRILYSFIALLAMVCAIFAPSAIGPRLAIIAIALLCACAFVFLGVMPMVRMLKDNARLSQQFEEWAESHPQYCVPERRRTGQQTISSDDATATAQVGWQER